METDANPTQTALSAATIIEKAEKLATDHVAAAEENAAAILRDAEAKAETIVKGARQEVSDVTDRIAVLRQAEQNYRAALRAIAEELLRSSEEIAEEEPEPADTVEATEETVAEVEEEIKA